MTAIPIAATLMHENPYRAEALPDSQAIDSPPPTEPSSSALWIARACVFAHVSGIATFGIFSFLDRAPLQLPESARALAMVALFLLATWSFATFFICPLIAVILLLSRRLQAFQAGALVGLTCVSAIGQIIAMLPLFQ